MNTSSIGHRNRRGSSGATQGAPRRPPQLPSGLLLAPTPSGRQQATCRTAQRERSPAAHGCRTQRMEQDRGEGTSGRARWRISSLRVKGSQPKEEDKEFSFSWRGAKKFSSFRHWRNRETYPGDSPGEGSREDPAKVNGQRTEPPNLNHGAIMSSEDMVGESQFKRLTTMLSSFREKLQRSASTNESDQAPVTDPSIVEVPAKERYTGQFFFEYLVVVKINKNKTGGYEPQIIYQFPKKDGMMRSQREQEEKTLKAITLFCFPDGIEWAPLTEYRSETFSFILTEMDGSRRNGYCRRLLPLGSGTRLPEAFCIVSRLACFGLFSKIFDEVEKRRQISMAMIYPFMQSLREAPVPAPGHTVNIKSFIPESGTEMIKLTRPLDSWLEHVDFHTLFHCLSDKEVLQVFVATVLERRIIFVAEELSTLSQVINAVTALLYPFVWQHTLISIVPQILLTVTMAPTPFLLGVQKHMLNEIMEDADTTNLLVVDLSEGAEKRLFVKVGDESSILPPKLQEELLQELSTRKENSSPEELKKVVSEAFVSFFVKTVGHFAQYVKPQDGNQPASFHKRSFYKAIEPKAVRHFVKKFLLTQMFDLFIQEAEQRQGAAQGGHFCRKIVEYQEKKKKEKAKKH
uniref:DENN/MADD domain containing 2Da n=2 Tax=Paramormyrops kingsleyae TaxID=1676925 RepID=A0A3B3T4T2_9TELE|nr:DENN domain-containing protein 2D-like isoform X1 [Paramormyrops kingsleyae]